MKHLSNGDHQDLVTVPKWKAAVLKCVQLTLSAIPTVHPYSFAVLNCNTAGIYFYEVDGPSSFSTETDEKRPLATDPATEV